MKSKYLFKSDRLGFRNWNERDLGGLIELNADQEVMEYFPKTLSVEETLILFKRLKKHYRDKGYTYFATELLGTQEFIGMIGFAFQEYPTHFTPAVDIGWRLRKAFWGNGYATEGAKRCIKYAIDTLHLDKIISVCTLNNKASEHIMKKIGMIRKGTFNHPELLNHPEYKEHYWYELKLKPEERLEA